MRRVELTVFNADGGYTKGIGWGENKDNDKSLEKYVLSAGAWMLEHASGECEIVLHINPKNCKLIK